MSPGRNFDFDAIVRSFPEPTPSGTTQQHAIHQQELQLLPVWNEDVLFGLMGNDFEG